MRWRHTYILGRPSCIINVSKSPLEFGGLSLRPVHAYTPAVEESKYPVLLQDISSVPVTSTATTFVLFRKFYIRIVRRWFFYGQLFKISAPPCQLHPPATRLSSYYVGNNASIDCRCWSCGQLFKKSAPLWQLDPSATRLFPCYVGVCCVARSSESAFHLPENMMRRGGKGWHVHRQYLPPCQRCLLCHSFFWA